MRMGVRRASLAGSYFCLFAIWGVVLPYLVPLLLHMGYSRQEAGILNGSFALLSAVVPTLAGWVGDRYLPVDRLLRVALLLLTLCSLAMWTTSTGPAVLFVCALLAFSGARAPLVALHDTLAMVVAHNDPAVYARMRVMGSAGFIASSTVAGWLLGGGGGSGGRLQWFFPLLVGVCLAALALSAVLPADTRKRQDNREKGFLSTLQRRFVVWLVAMTLHWFCFGPYHYGFTLLIEETGVPSRYAGVLWSLGVVAEIVVFLRADWFFERLSYRHVLFVAIGTSLLRWTLVGLAPHPIVVGLSQVFHGTGFALFWAAAMRGLHLFNEGRHQASYQGLFSTCVAGVGGILGMVTAGALYERMEMARVMLCMAPVEGLALLVLWRNPLKRG